MREIKFRAWNNRKMVYEPFRIYTAPSGSVFLEHPAGYRQGWETLMQYTGLKDKNGKEIYEGDILSDGLPPPRIVVEWAYYGWRPFTQTTLQGQHVEVIGNIYENPELMEAQ